MEAHKLECAKDLDWSPPSLSFNIARHGGTVLGSTREDIYHWQLNLDEKTAEYTRIGHRQVRKPAPPLTNAELIAKAISVCEEIKAGPRSNLKSDGHINNWLGPTEFRIKPSSLIPADGPNQTVASRRKRMRAILQGQIEAIGWILIDQSGPWMRFRKADNPSR
jgi:hypothetical protein